MSSESMRAKSGGISGSSVLVSLLATVAAFVLFGKQVELCGLYIGIQMADRLPPEFRPANADTVVLGTKSGFTALAAGIVCTLLLQLFTLARRASNPALRCQKCGQDLPGLVQLTCPKCRETA